MRVAFLGPAATFGAHSQHVAANGVTPHFVDVRAGSGPATIRAALAEAAPHVVIALDPDAAVSDAVATLKATTLAVIAPGAEAPEGFDRILRTPGPGGDAWRSRPLPVDDRLYADSRTSRRPPRALCVGRSTDHREWVLTPAKHSHDVLHYSHGLVGDALAEVLAATDIGIALNAEPGHGFPSQALLHLAAGQLLLSERLVPSCGLEPGIDFLEIDSRDGLVTLLMQLHLRPDAYERVRVRGRLKAEGHRASLVWPRIARDLIEDVRVFGTERATPVNTLEA
jgi:hypothetical protein